MKTYEKPDYEGSFDFYKCLKCGAIITHLKMSELVPTGRVCECGGLRASPIDPKWWQFLLPSVIRFALYRQMGWA